MITVGDRTKSCGSRRAVDDLSFEVHPARLSGLVIGSVPSIITEAGSVFGSSPGPAGP